MLDIVAHPLATPRVFGLLAYRLRWELTTLLAGSDLRVNELVTELGQPQNLISYHLAAFKRAGLVSERRSSADARDVYYHLELDRLRSQLNTATAGLHPVLAKREAHQTLHEHVEMHRVRVLFICSGNSARSLIAEAILRRAAGRAVFVRSAGPNPVGVHPLTRQVLSELGLPDRGLRSKPPHEFAGLKFDYVISLCDIAREECPPRPEKPTYIHWSLPDPAAVKGPRTARLNAFKRTASELEARIQQLLPALASWGGNHT
jgi:protein-tyrosine-phosphatase/DNA-binding transcriptional ArsR family regulator